MVSKNKYINEYKKNILVGGVENSVVERGEKEEEFAMLPATQ